MERAGLAGGTGPVVAVDATFVLTGDGTCVEVGSVVVAAGVLGFAVLWPTEVGPACGCPNSPGANEREEQKPSEELISSVRPSVDLGLVSTQFYTCLLYTSPSPRD